MTNVKVIRKDVPGDLEIQEELEAARKIPSIFQRRRAEAVIALMETGKRRSEIASLEIEDLNVTESLLTVSFTLRKKRKKNIHSIQAKKTFDINSKLAQAILRQLVFIREEVPSTKFLFPMNRSHFGTIRIFPERHMDPKEIWRIVKSLNSQDWPHLHRERRASKVILKDIERFGEAKLETVYRVKRILDLDSEASAWRYIRRFETQRVEEESEEIL